MFSISELMSIRDLLADTINEKSHIDDKKLLVKVEKFINDYFEEITSICEDN